MNKVFLLSAGAVIALAAGSAASAQSYSWGNRSTTYFYSPNTSDDYVSGRTRLGSQPMVQGPLNQPEPRATYNYNAPGANDYRYNEPGYSRPGYSTDERRSWAPAWDYRDQDPANLGQGSGMGKAFGR